jgi:hypothetical protein
MAWTVKPRPADSRLRAGAPPVAGKLAPSAVVTVSSRTFGSASYHEDQGRHMRHGIISASIAFLLWAGAADIAMKCAVTTG